MRIIGTAVGRRALILYGSVFFAVFVLMAAWELLSPFLFLFLKKSGSGRA